MTEVKTTRRPRRMARPATGAADKGKQTTNSERSVPSPAPSAPAAKKRQTKIATVIAMLGRNDGATLDELCEATGWLPHSTRAALTGLRKKGHVIAKTKRDDATCYRITGNA